MRTKPDGYYIEVKNEEGYPHEYVGLKITNNDTSRFWFGGGYVTRLAIFKTYKEARKVAKKQIRILQKKHSGKFVFLISSIKFAHKVREKKTEKARDE